MSSGAWTEIRPSVSGL